jgi:subtilisin inhibitor-like
MSRMLHMPRITHRALAAAFATAAAVTAAAPVAVAAPTDAAPTGDNHLVITVTGSGETDGTYELYCDPVAGQHPQPQEACEAIHGVEAPFAETREDALCTYMYGGPASAEVVGTWQGEPVRAGFDRSNGCEIARWDTLVPALPRIAG